MSGTAEPAAVTSRPLVGTAYGVVAAAVVCAAWFLASIGTKSSLVYLCIAVGIAVGYAVNAGARRGSGVTAAVAVAVTLIASVVGFYFVARASLIRRGYVRLVGADASIPLVGSYRLTRDVLRVSLRGYVTPYVYLAVALVAAGYLGLRGIDTSKRRAGR